jgi:HK97 gp10 family phage protein
MSEIVTFKIEGLEEIQDKLERLPKLAGKAIIKEALKRVGKIWRDDMAHRVVKGFHVFQDGAGKYKGIRLKGRSREYGVLSRSIRAKISVRGDELNGSVQVGPSKKAFWATWIEFGRKDQHDQKFIRPSFEENKEKVLEEFNKVCREELANNGMPVE